MPIIYNFEEWCANFQHEDFLTQVATQFRKSPTLSTPEIVDYVCDLILAYQPKELLIHKNIQEVFIIPEQLDMFECQLEMSAHFHTEFAVVSAI